MNYSIECHGREEDISFPPKMCYKNGDLPSGNTKAITYEYDPFGRLLFMTTAIGDESYKDVALQYVSKPLKRISLKQKSPALPRLRLSKKSISEKYCTNGGKLHQMRELVAKLTEGGTNGVNAAFPLVSLNSLKTSVNGGPPR